MSTAISYFLDTNVLLALLRANSLGQQIDAQFKLRSALNRALISVVTVGEFSSLARRLNWGSAKIAELQKLLNAVVTLDINVPEILDAYGEIDHFSQPLGVSMGKNDIWIAATVKVTGTTLLTTDKDFDHLHGSQINRVWIDPDFKKTP